MQQIAYGANSEKRTAEFRTLYKISSIFSPTYNGRYTGFASKPRMMSNLSGAALLYGVGIPRAQMKFG